MSNITMISLASAFLLMACSSSPSGKSDAAPKTDGPSMIDASSDVSAVDGAPALDAAVDARTKADSKMADAAPPKGAYLLWQAPGGFAGRGPAFEALSDGTVRLWKSTVGMQPRATSNWDHQSKVPQVEIDALFAMLKAIDYTKLPHKGSNGWECYPSFHFEACTGCAAKKLNYVDALALQPEFDAIYKWISDRLKKIQVQLPGIYCVLMT